MLLDQDFASIRSKADRESRSVSRKYRGFMIGDMEKCLEGASAAAGLEFGRYRKARLLLASSVFGRNVTSFNDLSDAELYHLHEWASTHGLELKIWMNTEYGTQPKLPNLP
jgi:hypothetical protein